MPVRKLVGRRSRILVLLAALILALPVIPAQAVPCDAYHIDTASLSRRQFRVVVATDEAWQQVYGAGAEAAAGQLIAEADRILEPAGVDLAPADYRTWATGGGKLTMSGLLELLEASVPAGPGNLVIGLTGHRISRVDGIAHVGHVHLVARRHPGRPGQDALLVAHEIGHLLGAEHHDCDHDYRCVMAPKGFELPARWCAHHLLEMQAARLPAE